MADPKADENISQTKAEWGKLVDHPYTTEPITRTSAVPEERAEVLAEEQAAYTKRFRPRPTGAEPQRADGE